MPTRRFVMDWSKPAVDLQAADAAAVALGPSPQLLPPLAASYPGLDLADAAVKGPQARSAASVTGAGLKIGIISDSYDVLGGAAADVAAGLLPAGGVTVLEEGPDGSSDEGRAMAELVHQTAPGAQLYFYSGFYSEADFAAGIAALQQAGCNIIVDDVTYPDEPMFQVAGAVDTAVQNAIASGVDYFTAVGNEGANFFQSAFTPVDAVIPGVNGFDPVMAETFGGGTLQDMDIPGGYAVTLTLEWDAAYNTPQDDSLTVVALENNTVAATSFQSGTLPEVYLNFPIADANTTYAIAIYQNAGTPTPGFIKYVLEGGGTIFSSAAGIGSGSEIGHALVPGINAVGAVDVTATPAEGGTPVAESYSSTGPGELLFAPDGTRLASPEMAGAPQYLAPDGASTSVIDPFFGTSSSAPVAAAVAALLLQASPSLNPADVTALLEDSAIPAGAASAAGAGLIQADRALSYARTGIISGSQQTVITGTSQPGTIQGGAGAHTVIAGSGNTLIQSSGTDTIQAGGGTDTVSLSGATALVNGGAGALFVDVAGSGSYTVNGGSGGTTVAGGSGRVTATGGGSLVGGSAGFNLLTAGDAPATLVAAGGNNTLTGGSSAGGNTFDAGGAGGDLVLATGGGNTILVSSNNTAIVLGGGNVSTGGASSTLTLADGSQLGFGAMSLPGWPN